LLSDSKQEDKISDYFSVILLHGCW